MLKVSYGEDNVSKLTVYDMRIDTDMDKLHVYVSVLVRHSYSYAITEYCNTVSALGHIAERLCNASSTIFDQSQQRALISLSYPRHG